MRSEEARHLLKVLNEPTSDTPAQALKALSFRRREQLQALFGFFALPMPEADQEETPILPNTLLPEYALFPHQRNAARQVIDALRAWPHRVVLHIATGAGQTRTAMNVITDHFRGHEPTVVIWLAHSEELCAQADEEFQQTWRCLGDRQISIYRFWENTAAEGKPMTCDCRISQTYSVAQRSAIHQ
jgi:hypothetical protein